ncbi:MAG: hypothetical protein J7527_10990, partial [Chitinophagaceae bacterium]|nr:hypothetical protein [Chitinophagaceae bacterium]
DICGDDMLFARERGCYRFSLTGKGVITRGILYWHGQLLPKTQFLQHRTLVVVAGEGPRGMVGWGGNDLA